MLQQRVPLFSTRIFFGPGIQRLLSQRRYVDFVCKELLSMNAIGFALLLLYSCVALGAVSGTVDSVSGSVQMLASNGKVIGALPGASVNEGDTVVTAENSWALLHMADGAVITVRPDTRLRLDEYRYSMASEQGRSFITLLRGTFRSVTGWIGRNQPSQYRISTPSATIGVRGTDHEPAYFPELGPGGVEPGTYDKVNEGETVMRTSKGELVAHRGQAIHHDPRFAPRILPNIPKFFERHARLDQRLSHRVKALRERFEKAHREHHERHRKHVGDHADTAAPKWEQDACAPTLTNDQLT
jgi:hypothetical protein